MQPYVTIHHIRSPISALYVTIVHLYFCISSIHWFTYVCNPSQLVHPQCACMSHPSCSSIDRHGGCMRVSVLLVQTTYTVCMQHAQYLQSAYKCVYKDWWLETIAVLHALYKLNMRVNKPAHETTYNDDLIILIHPPWGSMGTVLIQIPDSPYLHLKICTHTYTQTASRSCY